jgi:mono/diheme cytochrome c family protein
LPADLKGDLLFAEPVGRLIRRTKIDVKDGVTYLRNAYPKSEFIRSTDPNFRPVNLTTAPDGTLYIVDMYRGIIQEGRWVGKDSYLRKVVQQYKLDQNFGRGRIWRLVHDDDKTGPQPRMLNEKSKKLVKELEHPNGWWRDTAQKLLIRRGDKSVVPALTEMAFKNKNHLARIHALWTLEGLDALDPSMIRHALEDSHPQVRVAAIRTSETLYKAGDKSLISDVIARLHDSDPNVVIQAMMTLHFLQWPDAPKLIQTTVAASASAGVKEIGHQLLEPASSFKRELNDQQKKLLARGDSIYKELCFSCHGTSGTGAPVEGGKHGETMAPSLSKTRTVNSNPDELIAVLLKGRTGPINKKNYQAQMVPMESNDDYWIAAITSYVRNSFDNIAPLIFTNDVARVREMLKARTEPWTTQELTNSFPQPLDDQRSWKMSASNNQEAAALAKDRRFESRYDSDKMQAPGMWFQIELPQPTLISGLQLDAGNSLNDYPRGYKVQLSDDGATWGEPVATGKGDNAVTEIRFTPAKTKFIRITLTASGDKFWAIHELEIWQPPQQTSFVSKGGKAKAQFE